MRKRLLHAVLATSVAGSLLSNSAAAGENKEGNADKKETKEKVKAPRDAASGQASGKRQHAPRDAASGQASGK